MVANSQQERTRRLRLARFAVIAYFFLNGVIIATWAARIPAIQARLALSPGQLGLALFGGAIGALISMNTAGRISKLFGSKIITTTAAICLCIALSLLAFAPNFPLLILALVFFGASNGAMDVTMNLQGTDVERAYGRPIFNSFHACYSIGGLGGAFLGGIMAGLNINPLPHFIAISICTCIGILASMRFLLPSTPTEHVASKQEHKRGFVFLSRTLLFLGLIALCSVLSEGAMSDWSALYLSGTVHAGAALAAAGYATFSLFMAIGRGVGDRLVVRFGRALLIRIASSLAALGLALALLIPITLVVFAGLALVGIGLSVVFPMVLNAASHSTSDRSDAGTALATVSTCGYFGLLAGPPVIGFVADLVGLHLALVLVVGLCAIAALCAPAANTSGVQSQAEVASAESETLVL